MNHFDPNTRFPDGSYRYLPDQSVIDEVLRRRELRSENVPAQWEAPGEVAELLGRVYPDGIPEAWVKFFAGEEVEDADREKIRAALKPHAKRPSDSGLLGDERLLSARKEIESALEKLSWLDAASEEDHWKIVNQYAGNVAQALSERAGLEKRKASIDFLFEKTKDEIRASARRAKDLHLCFILAEAIISPRRNTGLPDAYLHLLPKETVTSIEFHRQLEAGIARAKREAEEKRRREEAEAKERELQERQAFVEGASFDQLLDLLLGHNPESSILHAFRQREKLTDAQLAIFIDLRDTPDPVKRRGFERLVELASSIGVAVLTPGEIDELQARRLQEENERKEREIERELQRIVESDWPTLCAEACSRGLVPGEWQVGLARITDTHRVTLLRDHFRSQAGREEAAGAVVNARICELMAARLPSKNIGMPGFAG